MKTKEALITYVNLDNEITEDFYYTILRGTEQSQVTIFSGRRVVHVHYVNSNNTFNRIFGVILLCPQEVAIVLTRD